MRELRAVATRFLHNRFLLVADDQLIIAISALATDQKCGATFHQALRRLAL